MIGVLILCTGKTDQIIIISVFGALSLYALSMLSVLKLRKAEPHLKRPFMVPFYPFTPIVAFVLSLVCIVALCYAYGVLAIYYFGILLFFYLLFKIFKK